MKDRIVFTGYFGAGNFGDDLMLEVFAQKIVEENLPINLIFLKLLPGELDIKLPNGIKVIDLSKYTRKIKQMLFFFLMLRNDLFLWIGGTIFTDTGGEGEYGFMRIAKTLGKDYGYLGIGLTNLTIPRRIKRAKYALNNASILTFRDPFSFKECEKYISESQSKYLTADLAYMYNFKCFEKTEQTVVSWVDLTKEYSNKSAELKPLKNLANWILAKKLDLHDILIVPLHNGVDHEMNTILFEYLQAHSSHPQSIHYLGELSTKEKVMVISISKNNILGRLHGIFVSELSRGNTVSLSYSPKMEEFVRSINQSQDNVSIYNFTHEDLDAAFDSNKLATDERLNSNLKLSKKNIDVLKAYIFEEEFYDEIQ